MGADTVHPGNQILRAYGMGKLDDVSAESVSKHVSSCPDCERRVAELSSDSFLGRLRGARGAPTSSATENLQFGGSLIDRGPTVVVSPPRPEALPPCLGDHPDYDVKRELGRGGMGVVYLAHNRLMRRDEVLKVMGRHVIERPGLLDRFLREIRAVAQLRHPNIVAAYHATRLGESIVFAMEHVDGLDLSRMVKAKGPLPVEHACAFVHQAALGLQHAHERGMVHRDIKPANLILARDGNRAVVKVLDFGLAKVTSEGQADSGLTREGQMLGTPDYIAPEQIRDAQSADIRADIYSLGCTFYYLLTGEPPFRGAHLWDVYQAHFSMEAAPLNLIRPEVPVELAALVAKLMAKEPGRRFQAPAEVAQALAPFFKKRSAAVSGLNPDISRAEQPEARRSTLGSVSVATWPASEVALPPVSAARTPAATQPASIQEGVIELCETEPLSDAVLNAPLPVVAPQPSRSSPRSWSSAVVKLNRIGSHGWWVAGGILLLGSVVAFALVIRIKTSNGAIELVNLPRDAEVLVDGNEVAVTWPGGGKPALVTVTAGKHKLTVKKDGLEISGAEVTVQSEGKEEFKLRFVPPAKLPSEPSKVGGNEVTVQPEGKEEFKPRFVPPSNLPGEPSNAGGAESTRTANTIAHPEPSSALKKTSFQGSIKNSIGMTLVLIPAGELMMGSADGDTEAAKHEKPAHRVRFRKPFYMGDSEVTQAQYRAVMGNNPSWFSADGGGKDQVEGKSTDRYPVENVSWLDAVRFCYALSRKEGKKPYYELDGKVIRVPDWNGQGYRLPTEAEWEYACRANAPTHTRYSFGDDDAEMGDHGWFPGIAGSLTQTVSQKRPNGFGLYDIHGNVWEWCWDWYGLRYYRQSAVDDPTGPATGSYRVIRGGGWANRPNLGRSANRWRHEPEHQSEEIGFRVALCHFGR